MYVAPDFLPSVVGLCLTMLARVEESADAVRDEYLDDLHGEASLPGKYRVTAGGRRRWEGNTLAGAIARLLVNKWPTPTRIWHVNPDGQRRLVMVANGNDLLEEHQ